MNREEFRKPNPIRTPNKFRNNEKLCAYHNEIGHNTSEYWALRDAIEDQIRRSWLRDYVVRPTNHPNQQPAQLPPLLDNERALMMRTIYTIHGGPHLTGTSHRSHEKVRMRDQPCLTSRIKWASRTHKASQVNGRGDHFLRGRWQRCALVAQWCPRHSCPHQQYGSPKNNGGYR